MSRKILLSAVLLSPFLVAFAASEMMSERTFVYVQPELSSFWRTAADNVVELPVDMPLNAKSATLRVSGVRYERTYQNLTEGVYRLVLPEATSPDKENLYSLVLSFDDGTVRTAEFGVIEGIRTAVEGCSTRCRLSSNGLSWRKTSSCAVIPVPYGMTSFAVTKSGEEIQKTVLDGAQGWSVLGPVNAGCSYDLELACANARVSANVLACNPGVVMVLR